MKNGSFCNYYVKFAPKFFVGLSFGLHVEKGFSEAQCNAIESWYLCKHAKKEYCLTAVIKREQFLERLSIDTMVYYMYNASQQLFRSKKKVEKHLP